MRFGQTNLLGYCGHIATRAFTGPLAMAIRLQLQLPNSALPPPPPHAFGDIFRIVLTAASDWDCPL